MNTKPYSKDRKSIQGLEKYLIKWLSLNDDSKLHIVKNNFTIRDKNLLVKPYTVRHHGNVDVLAYVYEIFNQVDESYQYTYKSGK